MKFNKNDKVEVVGIIRYGQDFSFWEGDFPGIVFTVDNDGVFDSNGGVNLKAPGYGEIGGDYGNGSIYVYERYHNQIRVLSEAQASENLQRTEQMRVEESMERASRHIVQRKVQWR